jgi:hypothetical protein
MQEPGSLSLLVALGTDTERDNFPCRNPLLTQEISELYSLNFTVNIQHYPAVQRMLNMPLNVTR